MRKSNLLLKKRNKYHQLLSFQSKNKTDREVSTSYALSFYTSQTVLGWSKFFVPDQKFIYKLWQSQKFCARQKDDLHSVKLVFVPAQKFL